MTAWYDLRNKENNPLKDIADNNEFCVVDHYMKSAELLFTKAMPLIVFTESKYEAKMWELRPLALHPLTRIIVKDYDDLNNWTHFAKWEENHRNKPIWNLHAEKFTALYKFVVNQKTEFVREAIMINPFSTEKFAWMDLRLHSCYDMSVYETNRIFAGMKKDRVLIPQMAYTSSDDVEDRDGYYSLTRGKMAAGFFGGYAEPLRKFCELCRAEFMESVRLGYAPTDEMIYAYVVAKNMNLFMPYFCDYREVLKNIKYVTAAVSLAYNYLSQSFLKGTHFQTTAAAEAIRLGWLNKCFTLGANEIYQTWYYNYVANYWLGNREHCKHILNELYEIACADTSVQSYISSVFDFFRQMISYIGDDALVAKFDRFK